MVNKAILIGRLGADPDIRTTPAGKSVGEIRIATSFGTGDAEKTEWHRVVLWEKLAENAAKYLTKGQTVYVEGRLQTRDFTDKDGAKRYITEVVATDLKFLSPKSDKPGAEANTTPTQPTDDLPF